MDRWQLFVICENNLFFQILMVSHSVHLKQTKYWEHLTKKLHLTHKLTSNIYGKKSFNAQYNFTRTSFQLQNLWFGSYGNTELWQKKLYYYVIKLIILKNTVWKNYEILLKKRKNKKKTQKNQPQLAHQHSQNNLLIEFREYQSISLRKSL